MEPIFMLAIGCVAGLSFSLSVLKNRGKRRSGDRRAALPGAARGLLALRPGDVVQHTGSDLLVEAAERLEATEPWRSACWLSDGSARWLLLAAEVAAADDEAAWLLREVSASGSAPATLPEPPTAVLHRDGLRHRLVGRFRTSALPVAVAGPRAAPARSLHLILYRGPGSRRLLLCASDGQPARTYAGEAVAAAALSILPGSDAL